MTRDPLAGKIPVTLITGYLGSGKTTLLSRLLRDPGMNRAAVIINEFGSVGIDHDLVQSSTETTLLASGCLCCAVRTDLQETMRDLFARRRSGEVIDFDRVFIEASGLADPVPVLHTLRTDGLLGAHYRLDAVVTLVDAVNGMDELDRAPEATRQVAVADRIVVTKTDIANAEGVTVLEDRLARLNPYAQVARAVDGRLDPEFLRDIAPRSTRASGGELERWLNIDTADGRRSAPGANLRASGDGTDAPYLGERLARHDTTVRAFCLWFDRPFAWDSLSGALHLLSTLRGPDLLRVKGLVNVEGEPGPVVVQGAQHVFHPPVTLQNWPGEDRRSRLVFIGRSLEPEAVEQLLQAVCRLQ